jgi:hypothetical protein
MRSAVIRVITIAIILAVLSSCASSEKRSVGNPEQILATAMGEGRLQPGRVSSLPGADRSDLPYVPVITPPQIARVWIYDHVTPSNDLVVGHWIFVRLKEEKWYIEEQWEDSSTLVRKRPALPPASEASNAAAEAQIPPEPSLKSGSSSTQSSSRTQGLAPVPPAER